MRTAFNAGAGAGALLAGVLVAGGTAGYRWIVGLNVLCFALAAALLVLVRVQRAPATTSAQRGTYRTVLRDRPFLGLVGATGMLWLSIVTVEVVLPPYLVGTLHAPSWIVGVLFTINTGMIVVLQVPVAQGLASWRRTRSLAASGMGFSLVFLLFAAAPRLSPALLPLYLCGCIGLYTLAEIIYAPLAISQVVALAPAGMQGRYVGIYQLALAVGSTMTPTLAASLLAANAQALWLLLAPLMLGAAGLLITLERRLPAAALRATRVAAKTRPDPEGEASTGVHVYTSGQGSLETRSAE